MSLCLIVDDSAVIRKVARRIVEGAGYSVVEAADASEALIACRRAMPNLILLDGMMPGMGGADFLLKLRKMPGGDAPKVVYCSTEVDVAQMARANRAGANFHLQKPFDREILLAKLAETGTVPAAV
ncbi:response regulator [Lutibaculum baratangense]|uniref:Chemotaxis regulator-transmits chemoreceptor signals to flagelllar motor components CheY n=1 Tax=Lutibaculum baratangense AMV1 TaxID=631454 RepID=V4RHA8_9HYPH|nr:response regulator [Lutibaculum baratangense]ESR22665.1 Chemotaxis regulator - transmits chemoreceptor signals to flagelllar motor components CheY [Lutibaculum baratangense AMV1]